MIGGREMPEWLNNAVFYEIYPQSFYDTNGDGIGDFNGITGKLDYILELGCNALWLNPCFDSPFRDAGYDVRDYKKTAARYGTNEDLYRLFEEAHRRGIRVLLDLVPGHTSEEHHWFRMSQSASRSEYDNRYIWTGYCFQGAPDLPFVSGESERSGAYILNFFKCQPALNYGFLRPTEAWQLPADHPDCIKTREAMKDVMRFWMDHGCDGFRVDMAASLVKHDDEKKTGTSAVWRNVRSMFDRDYPECALVSEWSNPQLSLAAGFHMDFLLNERGSGYNRLLRDYENHAGRNVLSGPGFIGDDGPQPVFEDHSFFKKDAGGDITAFLDSYVPAYQETRNKGQISMLSCNHDTVRPTFNLSRTELKLFYAFLFTMPGVPFLYYGDEIGMKYLNLPTREGGYFRTGSRTPMQWTAGRNLGFSEADADRLYLPVDPSEDAPNAADEAADPDSLLNTIRALLALRHRETDLQASGDFEVLYAEKEKLPFVYRRGHILLAVNTGSTAVRVPPAQLAVGKSDAFRTALRTAGSCASPLSVIGDAALTEDALTVAPQSFAAFRI